MWLYTAVEGWSFGLIVWGAWRCKRVPSPSWQQAQSSLSHCHHRSWLRHPHSRMRGTSHKGICRYSRILNMGYMSPFVMEQPKILHTYFGLRNSPDLSETLLLNTSLCLWRGSKAGQPSWEQLVSDSAQLMMTSNRNGVCNMFASSVVPNLWCDAKILMFLGSTPGL